MPEKKADKKRYWLTFLFKDLPVGATFKPHVLHLTIITWFVTELTDEQVQESFNQTFSGQKTFEINIGKQDEFKHNRKISVNLISSSPELALLHQKGLNWFNQINARWAVKNPHIGDEFIPHFRRRQGHNFEEGDKLTISSLSLVSAYRRGDDLRTVSAKVVFR
ncbi:MAG TPA: 2'-5' RNA ligase family protein [Candidatus Saccharimonadales bacterium]|nr:2'-5' RNA ligase family protein [Candidatus Saccharimonadales bacterium]